MKLNAGLMGPLDSVAQTAVRMEALGYDGLLSSDRGALQLPLPHPPASLPPVAGNRPWDPPVAGNRGVGTARRGEPRRGNRPSRGPARRGNRPSREPPVAGTRP